MSAPLRGIDLQIVAEPALTRRHRRQAGDLLAAEWGAAWRRDAHAGPHPPVLRALATNRSNRVVGHLAAFELACRPAVVLFGLGDLVVKPRYRERGIARALAADLVQACRDRGARALLVDTLAARAAFLGLGFADVPGFTYFYERDGACHRHRHWLHWQSDPLAGPVQILAHGDF